jgi:hypothetical protein
LLKTSFDLKETRGKSRGEEHHVLPCTHQQGYMVAIYRYRWGGGGVTFSEWHVFSIWVITFVNKPALFSVLKMLLSCVAIVVKPSHDLPKALMFCFMSVRFLVSACQHGTQRE